MPKRTYRDSNKRFSKRLLFTCAVVIFALAILAAKYVEKHTFSSERWKENEDVRKYMITDLLKKHPLVGMSEDEVLSLLGPQAEKGSQQATFKGDRTYYPPESTLVYYIGQDLLEGRWLVLPIKDGTVEKVVFGWT